MAKGADEYVVEWDGEGVYAAVYLGHAWGSTLYSWKRAGTREQVTNHTTIADRRQTRYARRRDELPWPDRTPDR